MPLAKRLDAECPVFLTIDRSECFTAQMRRVTLAPFLILAVVMVSATVAYAGFESTCTFDEASARVEGTLVGDDNFLSRNGDAIALNDDTCMGATVYNTDTIVMTADELADPNAELTIFLSPPSGPFAPGATDEGGVSEIEIEVIFGDSGGDTLHVVAYEGAQRIAIRGPEIDLDSEDVFETDVQVSGLGDCDAGSCDLLDVITGEGPDRLRQRPDDEGLIRLVFLSAGPGDDDIRAGTSATSYTFANGEEGSDVLVTASAARLGGGPGADLVVGGASDDGSLYGNSGHDRIFGRGGNDVLNGADGPDVIVGGRGRDGLSGGPGDDRMWGGGGPDELAGGDGVDRCAPERGWTLAEQGCEQRLEVPPPAL